MPILLSTVLTLLCAPAAGPAAMSAAGQAAPLAQDSDESQEPGPELLWVGEHARDLGTIASGESVEQLFSFMSAGERDLVVEAFETDCQCTTFEATRLDGQGQRTPYIVGTPLPPGDTIELALLVDTTGKWGDLAFNVRIRTNMAKPYTSANVSLHGVQPLYATPDRLGLGSLKPDGSAAGTVEIASIFDEPFVLEVSHNPFAPHIETELAPVEPDEQGRARRWTVAVTAHGGLPFRPAHKYPLEFSTRFSGKPEFATADSQGNVVVGLTLPVIVEARPWVSAQPQKLDFGRLFPKRAYVQVVKIVSNDEDFELALTPADVRILGYNGAFEWLDHVRIEMETTAEGVVEIRMHAEDFPVRMKPFQGYLSIRVGHPQVETIEVPFSGAHR